MNDNKLIDEIIELKKCTSPKLNVIIDTEEKLLNDKTLVQIYSECMYKNNNIGLIVCNTYGEIISDFTCIDKINNDNTKYFIFVTLKGNKSNHSNILFVNSKDKTIFRYDPYISPDNISEKDYSIDKIFECYFFEHLSNYDYKGLYICNPVQYNDFYCTEYCLLYFQLRLKYSHDKTIFVLSNDKCKLIKKLWKNCVFYKNT